MTPSPATHCVLCGFEAVLAPRVHLRELVPGAPPGDVTLGLCEMHGGRLRKGELRVLLIIESWLTAEGRLNPANPLHGVRLVAHCLACDAPLDLGRVGGAATRTRRLPGGELVVECPVCPMGNVVESIGGDPAAVQLWQAPARPRSG
jgi:hypothetical protein